MQIYNKNQLSEIAFAIKNGKAAVLPTDTVWGIVCTNENKIYQLKKRPLDKKISKFVSSVEDIRLPQHIYDIVRPYMMSGNLSIIYHGINYRVPKCSYLINLLRLTGPLFQSSANVSGKPPIQMSQQAFSEFHEFINSFIIVDNSPWEHISNVASTIVDVDKLTVNRQGPVDGQHIINMIKGAQ